MRLQAIVLGRVPNSMGRLRRRVVVIYETATVWSGWPIVLSFCCWEIFVEDIVTRSDFTDSCWTWLDVQIQECLMIRANSEKHFRHQGSAIGLPTGLQGAGTEVTLRNDVYWIVVSLGYLSAKRVRVSLERRDVDDVVLVDLRVETSFRQRDVTGTSVVTQESACDTWRRFSGRRINRDVDEGCPQFCYCFGSRGDVREKKQRRVSSSSLVRASLSRRVTQ